MLMRFKKRTKEKTLNKVIYSPVYEQLILGSLYKPGDFIAHARIKVLLQKTNIMMGIAHQEEHTLYFVASHERIVNYINEFGAVPLSSTQDLSFFKDKKRMNAHLNKLQRQASAAV